MIARLKDTVSGGWRRVRQWAGEVGRFELVGVVTGLYLIIYVSAKTADFFGLPLLGGALAVVAAVAVASGEARRRAGVWATIAVIQGVILLLAWNQADNHLYLAGYWTVALATAAAAPEAKREGAVRKSAAALVVLTMLWAVLHKLRTPGYVQGDFFYFAMLTDRRFEFFGFFFQHDLPATILHNKQVLGELSVRPEVGFAALKGGPSSLHEFARYFGLGVAFLELAVGVAFMLPADEPARARGRHLLLIVFVLGTYTCVPVPGFGVLLVILGLAQTDAEQTGLRLTYLALIPYVYFVADWLRMHYLGILDLLV